VAGVSSMEGSGSPFKSREGAQMDGLSGSTPRAPASGSKGDGKWARVEAAEHGGVESGLSGRYWKESSWECNGKVSPCPPSCSCERSKGTEG
jgi:hypothetical protein